MATELLLNDSSNSSSYLPVNFNRSVFSEAFENCENVANQTRGTAAMSVKAQGHLLYMLQCKKRAMTDKNPGTFSSCPIIASPQSPETPPVLNRELKTLGLLGQQIHHAQVRQTVYIISYAELSNGFLTILPFLKKKLSSRYLHDKYTLSSQPNKGGLGKVPGNCSHSI